MNLDRVTITGADESIAPKWLINTSLRWPFVEWGILVGRSRQGTTRYPSADWIHRLKVLCGGLPINLSLHVCGHWVRELLLGRNELPVDLIDGFRRVQLNFHAEKTACDAEAMHRALAVLGERQFIFQIDGVNGNKHLESLYEANLVAPQGIDAVPLFDLSGGAGILPEKWPRPMHYGVRPVFGYAGGLGPENLAEQLPLIAEAAGTTRFWIDMETKVRSHDDELFDLSKVTDCLKIAAPHVSS